MYGEVVGSSLAGPLLTVFLLITLSITSLLFQKHSSPVGAQIGLNYGRGDWGKNVLPGAKRIHTPNFFFFK